jgi:transcriptional regulator with XRE-family HTH domain
MVLFVKLNIAAMKAIRDLNGLNSTDLAALVGVTQGHLSNIEAGRRRCPPRLIVRIAGALSVPIAAIVERPSELENVA